MGRPSISASLSREKMSNDERERRIENEKKLKGNNDKLKPPSYMSKEAKKIFKFLVTQTEEAQTFGNVDIYILTQISNTYANYERFQKMLNVEQDFTKQKELTKIIKSFSSELPRLYNELGLTPSTRAKLGALNLKREEEEKDPLLQILEKRRKRLED